MKYLIRKMNSFQLEIYKTLSGYISGTKNFLLISVTNLLLINFMQFVKPFITF